MTLAITVIILLAILALLLYKMSTTDQTARVQVTLATATDVVSFPYKFLESNDLVVTSDGRGTLVLDTDYSVTGAGDSSGGDVTMIGGTVAERITVTRSTDNSQETTIATNGPLSSSGLEAALDKLTKITQDQSEEISRALTLPHSEVNGFSATIASATTRANKVLAFDENGDSEYLDSTALESASDAILGAQAAQAAAELAQASAEALVYNRLQGRLGRLRYELDKILNGDRETLNVIRLGDSLGYRIGRYLENEHLKYWFPNEAITYQDDLPRLTGFGGRNVTIAGTGSREIKSNYILNATGTYYNIDSAEYIHFSASGAALGPVDKVIIPFHTDSNGGVAKVRISDNFASVGDTGHADWSEITLSDITSSQTLTGGELLIDTNSVSFGTEIVVLEFSSPRQVVLEISHESGTGVLVQPLMFESNSVPTINYYDLYEGSNTFTSVSNAAAPLMASIWDELRPDIIVIESDDGVTSQDAIVSLLELTLNAMTLDYKPFILFVGMGPKESVSYDLEVLNNYIGRLCVANGYAFVDGRDIVPDWNEMIALGTADGWVVDLGGGTIDGVHLGDTFYKRLAQHAALKYGFDKSTALAKRGASRTGSDHPLHGVYVPYTGGSFVSSGVATIPAIGTRDFTITARGRIYNESGLTKVLLNVTGGSELLAFTFDADDTTYADGALRLTIGSLFAYVDTGESNAFEEDAIYTITADRDGYASFYRNKVLLGQFDISSASSTSIDGTALGLFYSNSAGYEFGDVAIMGKALSRSEVVELATVGLKKFLSYSPHLLRVEDDKSTDQVEVWSKWFGTGTISSATTTSFDVDAGASGLVVRPDASDYDWLGANRYAKIFITFTSSGLDSNFSAQLKYAEGASQLNSSIAVSVSANSTTTIELDATLLVQGAGWLALTEIDSTSGGSISVDSIRQEGSYSVLYLDEGIGLQLKDFSDNNSDLLMSDVNVRHLIKDTCGSIRAFNVDAYNSGSGNVELLSNSQGVLSPESVVITGCSFRNNATGTIAAGSLDLKRSDLTSRTTIGDNPVDTATALSSTISVDEAAQDTDMRNIALDGSSESNATNVDVEVYFKSLRQ